MCRIGTSVTPSRLTRKPTAPTTPGGSGGAAKDAPATLALQDALREKEQHVDQLLKERDLERSEVARATANAEEADVALSALRAEMHDYRWVEQKIEFDARPGLDF